MLVKCKNTKSYLLHTVLNRHNLKLNRSSKRSKLLSYLFSIELCSYNTNYLMSRSIKLTQRRPDNQKSIMVYSL